VLNFVYLVALFPLLGFLTLMIVGRRLGEPMAGYLATAAVGGSFVSAVLTFIGLVGRDASERQVVKTVFEWVPAGDFSVDIGFLVDPLSVAMILFVTGIGTLIHLYSVGYMHGDENFSKFFIYLNMFVFAMLMLVLGDNLLLTFLGWEGVGACSYFLISFWHTSEANATAGKKAFVTNRVGDWGFMVAIFLAFATVGSIDYLTLNATASQMTNGVATGLTLLLFIGAMGKSAQFPLYLWLPDAMAGPTPVSALIHAATMVTSGVYLLSRMSEVLHVAAPWSTNLIAWVGAFTALFAATIAIAQNDIKKVLAYSTVSQLGYMILAVGTGSYVAAIFHMITHAFFKALLFLGSGSVIHGMANDQDMRRYGGLRKLMPVTAGTFIIGWLAIAGVPPFAGFWSKDEILLGAWDLGGLNGKLLWAVGLLTALITAFYMSRQVFMTFFGDYRFADPDPTEVDDAWAAYLANAEQASVEANTAADEAKDAHESAVAKLVEAREVYATAKIDAAQAPADEADAAKATVDAADAAINTAQDAEVAARNAMTELNDAAEAASSALREATSEDRRRSPLDTDPGPAGEFLPESVAARAGHHPHESPWQMATPLIVLAGLSIVGGFINLPFTKGLHFLGHWLEDAGSVHPHKIAASGGTKWLLAFVAIAAGVAGISAAYSMYMQKKSNPARVEKEILADGWGYDRAVTSFMGGPGAKLFDAIAWFDATVIDGIATGAASMVRGGGVTVRKLQTGFVRTYALGIAAGSVALLVWFFVRIAA